MSARDIQPAYLSGKSWGLPASVLIHRLANISCSELICGENCRIDAFVTLTGKVKLGDNCHVGTGVGIFAGHGFEAGDLVGISPGVQIFTATTDVDADCLAYHSEAQFEAKPKTGPVNIGYGSCIGANAVILPGVTIGQQVQVGANATIGKDLADFGVYVGPGKYIRDRVPLKYAAIVTGPEGSVRYG